jgi:hypothetical protein
MRALALVLVLLPTLVAYVHDPRKSKQQKGAGASSAQKQWDAEWSGQRKLQLGRLLRQLEGLANAHADVLEYYTGHPHALESDGISGDNGWMGSMLLPALSLLGQEGLDSYDLPKPHQTQSEQQQQQEEEEGEQGKQGGHIDTGRESDAGVPLSAGVCAAAPNISGNCAGPIPPAHIGRNSSLPWHDFVVVVASAPAHFEYRSVMRATWLSAANLRGYHAVVLYAVGQVAEPGLEKLLVKEQSAHHDLLRTPSPDGYRNLSVKVFEAYELVLQQYRYRWLVRCDDNNVVQMDKVFATLLAIPPRHELRVWGNILKDAIVHRDRAYRNYELDFTAPAYPLFPTGCLHALTYPTTWWIGCMRPQLRRFKSADDTTVGIWLSVSPHKVLMSKAMYPVRDQGCKSTALLFRREDPPVTPEVIEKAWARRERCGKHLNTSEACLDLTIHFYVSSHSMIALLISKRL